MVLVDSWTAGLIFGLVVGGSLAVGGTLLAIAFVGGRKMPHYWLMGECVRCKVSESGVFAAMECPEG